MIELMLPVAGTLLVLWPVLFLAELRFQLPLVALGLLLVHAGVWRLARPLLPDAREFVALRAEVDRFVALVRELNRQAVVAKSGESPVASLTMQEIHREMRASAARMWSFAGKSGADRIGEPAPSDPAADPEGSAAEASDPGASDRRASDRGASAAEAAGA